MAANLSPEYLEAEREYKSAVTQAEKIAALERMLSTVPKHKGTEKLQADIKRKLAQARRESEKKGTARATPFFQVEKEGAGQVALVGPPNAGKSQLLATLTRARPEVADYPFTTRLPMPGMMPFENIQIQLVDLPPFSPEFMESWLPQAVRNVNAAVLLVDVNDPGVLDQVDFIEETFAARHLPRPDLLAANKIDLPGAAENFDALADLYRGRYRMLAVSALTGRNLEEFRRAVYETLRIVRVYTKVPGKPAELKQPFILKRGLTVEDAARLVHRDFAENLKYARLYRMAGGRDGLMVERTHTVEDEDILEFHV